MTVTADKMDNNSNWLSKIFDGYLFVNLARLLSAIVFIFSGFVKAVDPLGTSYKLDDYIGAFSLSPYFPEPLPLIFAVLLAILEFAIGVYMLFGIRRKLMSVLMLIFMCIMTPLTLYLFIANPVTDCGCFGDAIILSNGQTFAKNVVLLCLSIVVFRNPDKMLRLISHHNGWMVSLYSLVFIAFFCMLSIHYLPLIDFRPYKIGVNIPAAMTMPEGAKQPKYETTFVLEKNGEQKTYTIDNYPDSTWKFITSESKMISPGYVPPITDFSITDDDGNDMTDSILNDKTYRFVLISPHFERADDGTVDVINTLNDYCKDNNYHFCALTASGDIAVKQWKENTGGEYPVYFTDDVVLRTVVRSNPGLLLIKDGTIYGKWSCNNLPDESQLQGRLENLPIGQVSSHQLAANLLKLLMWYLIPLLLLTFADRIWVGSQLYKKYREHNQIKKAKKMRKKIVAGNWKMNKNLQEGVALAKELNEVLTADKPNCGVIICTPFIHLASVAPIIDSDIIGLGAENCADKVSGAFTGEVSAEMVKSTGADYVILGHSERRAYYHETPEILKEKVNLALANGLKVIFCIGEVLEERESNRQNEVVKAQLEGSLFDLTAEQFNNIILAYEPVWAIGTGKTATSDQAEEMHAFIRATIAEKFGAAAAENVSILYGGSCKPSNAKELFSKPDVDGGLIGGAALKSADFKGIIDAWK